MNDEAGLLQKVKYLPDLINLAFVIDLQIACQAAGISPQ
jgi:hypothetical protein